VRDEGINVAAMGLVRRLLPWAIVYLLATFSRGQEASLAPADLEFTRGVVAKFHFTASVEVHTSPHEIEKFQYDCYPWTPDRTRIERVKRDEGTFVRPEGGTWVRSDDWGTTSSPVRPSLLPVLNTDVNVVNVMFAPSVDRDASQGGPVWTFIRKEESKDNVFTYYTYERSREHPLPGGLYPQYTFMKAAHDVDGRLFLRMFSAQLRSGDDRIPVVIRMTYLIPIAAGGRVEVFDKNTGRKEFDKVLGKNSGWEITAQQSEPPPGD
jgi:hypothetical protein